MKFSNIFLAHNGRPLRRAEDHSQGFAR